MSLALNVLMIEDESPAAEKLARYLQKYSSGITVKAICDSVQTSVSWQLNQKMLLALVDSRYYLL